MAGAACCSAPCREAAGAMCAPDASARAVLCLRASQCWRMMCRHHLHMH